MEFGASCKCKSLIWGDGEVRLVLFRMCGKKISVISFYVKWAQFEWAQVQMSVS
ncbi:hypothetical protein [Moraxella caviae]|uniref:hypothetical protein n=1 Tax=Moraxella caviae TaxID=34060 RepID=UPI0013EF8430|nr:hypothetical protein [Moraxella caviae]